MLPWGKTAPCSRDLGSAFSALSKRFNLSSRQHIQTLTNPKQLSARHSSGSLYGGCMTMRGVKVYPGLHVLQKSEVDYVLLRGRKVNRKRGGYFLAYLLSSRLRPAMCCSKDLTPKPLLFLLLSAPSSLTGVEASCLSLQSFGEPRLLLSDLYCTWTKNNNGK